jgi:hypothetical protein
MSDKPDWRATRARLLEKANYVGAVDRYSISWMRNLAEELSEEADAIKEAYIGGLKQAAYTADCCGQEPSTDARNCILLRIHEIESGKIEP